MTSEQVKAIQDIQGTAGFRVIEYLIQQKMKELDSVSDIDGRSETRAGIQALAKSKAVKLLKDFISDLQLNPVSEKETRKTYE